MKTIQQLLELSENPHYKFMPDEREVLDDFLSKRAATRLKQSQKQSSSGLSPKTRVTVRNIVSKVDTYPPDSTGVA